MKTLKAKCVTAGEESSQGIINSRVLSSISLEVQNNFVLTDELKASLTEVLTNLATQYSAVEREVYSCTFEIV